MEQIEIYKMRLHETISFDKGYSSIVDNSIMPKYITRVAGGWIYTFLNPDRASVFVPYDNEFQKNPER